MYKILLLLLMTTLLSAKIYDGVAITVEDEAITLYDIQKMMQETKLDAKKAADILIRQKLEDEEIQKRNISVTDDEVYKDIKQIAQRNHMNIAQLYDAVREANGLTSSEFKAKMREKLLKQKLYQAIAMGAMDEPSDDEILSYFTLHKQELEHPSAFKVTIYSSKNQEELQTKVHNPMFYSPSITSQEQTLEYERISPQLATLLSKTKVDSFTPVVPNGQGGFMSFYLNGVLKAKDVTAASMRPQIINAIMAKKREEILDEYFTRLRDNSDIKIIRLPE